MAKSASNKAYLASKRKETEKDIARQQGMPVDDSNEFVDIFDSQAHHLLACLEKTTVRIDCSNSRLTVSCIEYPDCLVLIIKPNHQKLYFVIII